MFATRRCSARRARGGPSCGGTPHARIARTGVLVAAAALGAVACARAGGARAADRAAEPATEFLAVAGDSTYWVRNGPDGLRVRSAPLLLTRCGGRLTDVYVVDDAVRFDGAEFTTVRVYQRDLLTGDSTLVAADAAVPRLAARWVAGHPGVRPLDDEEDAEAEPALVAEHGVGLVAVHGAYVTLDLRTTVDDADRERRETLLRRVVDLRTGRPATLAALFGPAAPGVLAAAGRRAFDRARAAARAVFDTLHLAPGDSGVQGRARDALSSLQFDPDNFGVVAVDGAPAVEFVARGADADGAVTLALAPVPAAAAGAEPGWWTADVRPLLPAAAPDAARLLARVLGAPAGEPAPGSPSPAGRAEQLVRLDRPPADAALRHALRRAFDESALGDAFTTSVARYRSGAAIVRP